MRVLQGERKAKEGLVLSHNLKYVSGAHYCFTSDHIVVYHTVHYLAYLMPVQTLSCSGFANTTPDVIARNSCTWPGCSGEIRDVG